MREPSLRAQILDHDGIRYAVFGNSPRSIHERQRRPLHLQRLSVEHADGHSPRPDPRGRHSPRVALGNHLGVVDLLGLGEVVAGCSRSAVSPPSPPATWTAPGRSPTPTRFPPPTTPTRLSAKIPDVDIVYIASKTWDHHRDLMMAIDAGKHVLCEKPFTDTGGPGQGGVRSRRQGRRRLLGGHVAAVLSRR